MKNLEETALDFEVLLDQHYEKESNSLVAAQTLGAFLSIGSEVDHDYFLLRIARL